MKNRLPSPSTITVVILAAFLALVAVPAHCQELVELPAPEEVDFPQGYEVYDGSGKHLKSVPGPTKANVQAYYDREAFRIYLSDWSYARFREEGIKPNVMVARRPAKMARENAQSADADKAISEIRGVTEDGIPWAYEYLGDEEGVLVEHLWRDDDRELLYSNEEWVVTGQFIRIDPGRGKHEISFYDSRDLKLVFRVSVPNYVMRVDWSPTREQFFLITTRSTGDWAMVKYPSDIAQALVVLDPEKRTIERIRLVETNPDGEDWNFFGSLGDTRWEGNSILLHFPKGDLRLESDPRFLTPGFSDIKVISVSTTGGILESAREVSDHSGLRYLDLDEFAKDAFANPALGASIATLTTGEQAGTHLVRATPQGGILYLNLSTLRTRYFRVSEGIVEQAGIFDNGTLRAVSNGEIVFRSNLREVRRSVRDIVPGIKSEVAFTGTDVLIAARRAEESDEFSFALMETDGEVTERATHRFQNKWMDWHVPPGRQSFAFISGTTDGGIFWREFDWRSGKQIGSPVSAETGKAIEASEHRFGIAPSGWRITATCTGASTGGRDYTVNLVRESTGRSLNLGEYSSARRGRNPLVMLGEPGRDGRAFILSSGLSQAELLSVETTSGRSVPLQTWEWNPSDGTPMYSDAERWFFVPKASGFEVFSLEAPTSPRKVFEIVFDGEDGYAIVLPTNEYAGSPGCEAFLSLSTSSEERLPADVLALWRNRPAKVLAVLGGSAADVNSLEQTTQRWLKRLKADTSLPEPAKGNLPRVTLNARTDLFQPKAELSLDISVVAGSAPVSRVEVLVNGVLSNNPLEGREPLTAGESHPIAAQLTLSEGQNWIEIRAVDASGRSGPAERFRVIYEIGRASGRRFIVTMGVSEYRIPELKLNFGVSDSESIATLLEKTTPHDFKTLRLEDEAVTRKALEQIRDFLSEATENDEVYLFGAGHGALEADLTYVFFTQDIDLNHLSATGIALDEIIDVLGATKARKRLLLLDTCQSGFVGERDELSLAGDAPGTSTERIRFIEEMFRLPGLIRGVSIIGASRASEVALESPKVGGGFFTAAIKEAVAERKGDLNSDGGVQVSELRDFLSARVQEMSRTSDFPDGQLPSVVAFEPDQDFVISSGFSSQ